MQALSFYTPIYPKKSGSVRNNGLALRKDKVNVFVLRSVFYVQLPRLRVCNSATEALLAFAQVYRPRQLGPFPRFCHSSLKAISSDYGSNKEY